MNWSVVAKAVGTAAPLIGSLLGPAGGLVGALIANVLGCDASPAAVDAAIKSDPSALAKIRQLEIEQATELRTLAVQAEQNRMAADTQRIAAVNTTMQAEAKSEHWPQWAWRPFNGFAFGAVLVLNYALPAIMNSLVMPFLPHPPLHPTPPIVPGEIPEFVFVAWGTVLGVSAWHRGVANRVQAGEKSRV